MHAYRACLTLYYVAFRFVFLFFFKQNYYLAVTLPSLKIEVLKIELGAFGCFSSSPFLLFKFLIWQIYLLIMYPEIASAMLFFQDVIHVCLRVCLLRDQEFSFNKTCLICYSCFWVAHWTVVSQQEGSCFVSADCVEFECSPCASLYTSSQSPKIYLLG